MANLLKKLIEGGACSENRQIDTSGFDLPVVASSSKMSTSYSRVLGFHSTHGENVRLSKQGRLAKRFESFCQGLTFSSRPIEIDEIVVLKIAETSTKWNGVLRFGVTNIDPQTLSSSVPKYACPDMANKGTTWAKALTERFCQQGNIIHFYIRPDGEMFYGVNGIQKGQYLNNINVSLPLWVAIDIYGNTTAIEFLDPSEVPLMRQSIKSSADSNPSTTATVCGNLAPPIGKPQTVPLTTNNNLKDSCRAHVIPPYTHAVESSQSTTLSNLQPSSPSEQEQRNLTTAQFALELNERLSGSNSIAQTNLLSGRTPYPAPRFNTGIDIYPLEFHEICGRNIRISNDKILASRSESEYANGYVFLKRPLKINEKIIVQILKVVSRYSGSLAFGVTTCDPLRLSPSVFPDDSDNLMDRPEYWVVAKDCANNAQELEEISFYINEQGEVHYQRNDLPSRVIVYVDSTQKLWLFLDIFGATQKIRLVGGANVVRPVIPAAGGETRRLALPPPSTTTGSSQQEEPNIQSQVFHNQNMPQYQQLHVQLPPPQQQQQSSYQQPAVQRSLSGGSGGDGSSASWASWSGQPPAAPSPQPQGSPPASVGHHHHHHQAHRQQQMPVAVPRRRLRLPTPPNTNNSNNNVPPAFRPQNSATPFHNQASGPRSNIVPHQPPSPMFQSPPPQGHYFSPLCFPHQQPPSNNQQQLGQYMQQQPVSFNIQYQSPHRRSSYFGPLHQMPYNSRPPQHGYLPDSRTSPVPAANDTSDPASAPAYYVNRTATSTSATLSDQFGATLNLNQPQSFFATQSAQLATSSSQLEAAGLAENGPTTATPRTADEGSSQPNDSGGSDECVICFTAILNCVLYTCGHMCMCYDCAMHTWRQHGTCPICRQTIKDVIKTYKSSA